MKKKSIFCGLLVLIILVTGVMGVFAQDTKIAINLDGKALVCDVAPFNDNGTVMIPLRAVFEALNASVEWDNDTRTIFATKDSKMIILQIGNSSAFVDKEKVEPDGLKARLVQLKSVDPDVKVFINGDKNVFLGRAIDILDIVRKSGITKIAIETKPENK